MSVKPSRTRRWIVALITLILVAILSVALYKPPAQKIAPPSTVTMAGPSARILNDSGYSFYGTYHVVGEVMNTGGVALRFIAITATLMDQNGGVVDVRRGYAYGGEYEFKCMYLRPTQKAPFDILELDTEKSARISSYTLSLEYQQAPTPFENMLLIQDVSNSTGNQGFLTVAGEVKNNGMDTSKFTVVVGAFYDANGKVIYVGFYYLDVVQAGQTRGFVLDVNDAQISSRVRKYVLLAATPLPLDHVVINEVLIEISPLFPLGVDGAVELYNPTTTSKDLSGWVIQVKGGSTGNASLSQGTMIAPGGYTVLGVRLTEYNTRRGWHALILRDSHGDDVDRTPDLSTMGYGLEGFSWQRYPDGSDNWRFSPSTIGDVNIPELPSPALEAATILLGCTFVIRQESKRRPDRENDSEYE